MWADVGHMLLLAALFFSVVQAVAGLAVWRAWSPAQGLLVRQMAVLSAGALTLAFAVLVYVFAVSDFSVKTVVLNSHTLKPFLYKISAAWAHHEGSMVLWTWLLGLYGLMFLWVSGRHGEQEVALLRQRSLGILGLIQAGFVSFTFFTSTPFVRLVIPAQEGLGFNPILQHPAVALHPPLLYAGYVGFAVPLALCLGALLNRQVPDGFARLLRGWVLWPWGLLTWGIALGSWWAYHELGWGGWWFWDPVENASLMPWIAGAAMLHSVVINRNGAGFYRWTFFLSVLTFGLCVLGTFLVRSGLLLSVHAFASDPGRGMYLLALFAGIMGLGLVALLVRSEALPTTPPVSLTSRPGLMLLGQVGLLTILATVVLGTLYPLVLQTLHLPPVSVGPPYYEAVVTPLSWPILALMVVVLQPRRGWGIAVAGALALGLAVLDLAGYAWARQALGGALLVLIIAEMGRYLWRRWCQPSSKTAVPRRSWSMIIGHAGLAVLGLAMLAFFMGQVETTRQVRVGESFNLAGHAYELQGIEQRAGINFVEVSALIQHTHNGQSSTLMPGLRYYPVEDQTTVEAAVESGLGQDIYLTLTNPEFEAEAQALTVRVSHNPGMLWLWLGAFLTGLGGVSGAVSSRRVVSS